MNINVRISRREFDIQVRLILVGFAECAAFHRSDLGRIPHREFIRLTSPSGER